MSAWWRAPRKREKTLELPAHAGSLQRSAGGFLDAFRGVPELLPGKAPGNAQDSWGYFAGEFPGKPAFLGGASWTIPGDSPMLSASPGIADFPGIVQEVIDVPASAGRLLALEVSFRNRWSLLGRDVLLRSRSLSEICFQMLAFGSLMQVFRCRLQVVYTPCVSLRCARPIYRKNLCLSAFFE